MPDARRSTSARAPYSVSTVNKQRPEKVEMGQQQERDDDGDDERQQPNIFIFLLGKKSKANVGKVLFPYFQRFRYFRMDEFYSLHRERMLLMLLFLSMPLFFCTSSCFSLHDRWITYKYSMVYKQWYSPLLRGNMTYGIYYLITF